MNFRDGPSTDSEGLKVRCLLFATYAEQVGSTELEFAMPESSTVADAVRLIRDTVPNGNVLPEQPLVAVNLEHVKLDHILHDGDELALLPPLAGG